MRTFIAFFFALFLAAAPLSAQQPDTTKSNDPFKNTRAGNGFFKNKNFVQAEQKYREAMKTDSLKGIAGHNLGNTLYEQGKYSEAAEAFDDAARHSTGDTAAKAYYNKGNALFREGDYDASAEAYKEALRRNPNDEDARENLAKTQKMARARKTGLKDSAGNFKDDPNGKFLKKNPDGDKKVKQNAGGNPKNSNDPNGQPSQKPVDPKKQGMSADEARKVMSALKDSEQKTRQRLNQNGTGSLYKPSRDKDW